MDQLDAGELGMNQCVKTGADVWDTSYNAVLHGDLYRMDGYYVLRYVGEPQYTRGMTPAQCHAVFDMAQAEQDRQRTFFPARLVLPYFPPFLVFNNRGYGIGQIILADQYVKDQLPEGED